MNITKKLILGFSILISILIGEIIINQTITYRANQTYNSIRSNIEPNIKILEKCKSLNNELKLLLNSRVNSDVINTETNNRIKGIIDVELPYMIKEIQRMNTKESKFDTINEIGGDLILQINKLVNPSNKINNLLFNRFDNKNNLKIAKQIYKTEVVVLQGRRIKISLENVNNYLIIS